MISTARLSVGFVFTVVGLCCPAVSNAQSSLVFVGGGFDAPQRGYIDCMVIHPKHLALGAQLGLSGVKAGAGLWLIAPDESSSLNAVILRAVVLSTWGSPIGSTADRTYVGTELEGSWYFVPNFHIGVAWPIHRSNELESFVVTAGVGFRLPINVGWMGGG